MKTELWVMRHGPRKAINDPWGGIVQPHAPLSQVGRDLVRTKVSAMNRKFKFCSCSPFVRGYSTACVAMEVLGMEWGWIKVNPNLGIKDWKEWDQLVTSNSDTNNLVDLYHQNPKLHRRDGRLLYQELILLGKSLRDGEVGLAISHQPLIECAAATALNQWPPAHEISECGALVFELEDQAFSRCRAL